MAGCPIYTRHTLLDEEKNRDYAGRVGAVNERFGGEVIARGAVAETFEGDLQLPPFTMTRFPASSACAPGSTHPSTLR